MAIIGKLALSITILVLLVRLPCSVCFTFTKEPQSPITIVLGHNTTNVYMEWKYDAQGSTVVNIQLKRFLQSKDNSLSKETLLFYFALGFDVWNRTLYVFSASFAASGYANFTIKDVLKRLDNIDKTKVSYVSDEVYTYRLDVTTIGPSQTVTSSTVDLQAYFRPTITMYGCQDCVNGSVIENQTITLFCNATGKPMPNIRWTKNGEPYNISSPGNTLIIPQVTRDDKGNYTCIADNGIGIQDNRTIPILVGYKPDASSLSPPTFDACENNSINFSCTADAYPPVTNYSLYNGDNYLGSRSNGQFSITATPPGKNTLCCVATNEIGNSQCGHATVDVLGVIITPVCRINNETTSSATVNEGDEVVLQCDISGNESYYSYQWLEVKDGISRSISRAIQLRFDSINRTNEAQYQVILTDRLNCSASQLKSFNVTVNYKPENTMFSSDKKVFCEGNLTQVNCTADGKPDPVYSLYRNNEYLSGNENGVFAVTFAEKGSYEYTCVPNNTAGVGPNKSQNVAVKGPLNSEMCTINNKTNVTQIPVKELSLVDLRLTSSELDRLDFTWQNGTEIMPGLDSHNITFGSITRHEGGRYRVVARDRFNCSANVECIFTVDVHYPPDQPIISSSANKPTVDEGETVNLTCKAEANPKPYYLWIFMGKMLHGESNDTISLSNITPNDAGDYTCIAVNYLGNTTSKTNLMVEYFNEPSCEAVPPTVKEGENITLNCSVAAYPPANYTWNVGMEHTATVILTASPELDKKTFTCTVKNYRQSKNCTTASLEVLYQPRHVRILEQGVVVNESGVFNLTCITLSNPASNYTWSFNGRSIEGANSRVLIKQNISKYDAGKYQCTVSNAFGTAYNVTDVKVQYPPELKCKDKVFVIEGQRSIFSCNTSAHPDPDYTISYNSTNSRSSSLAITLSRSDNGSVITCMASNVLDSVQCTTVLIVTYPPDQPSILLSPNKTNANEGETVDLTCKAEANPKPYYLWIFKGEVLQGRVNDTISIPNITSNDAGIYTCNAVNDLGKSTAVTSLTVEYFREPSCEAIPAMVKNEDKITLNCSVAAYPPANYTWNIGDRIENTSIVILTASPEIHDKTFTCTVKNYRQSKNCTTTALEVLYFDQENICGNRTPEFVANNGSQAKGLSVNTIGLSNPAFNVTCPEDVNVYLSNSSYKIEVNTLFPENKQIRQQQCVFNNTVGNCSITFVIWMNETPFKSKNKVKLRSRNFTPDLQNNESTAFLNLKNSIKKTFLDVYKNAEKEYVTAVIVNSFENGSVWVNFELQLIANVTNPLQPLKDAMLENNGNINGLIFDKNSLSEGFQLPETTIRPTTTPIPTTIESTTPVPPDDPTVIIIVVIIVVLVIIAIAGVVIWWYCKRKSPNGKDPNLMNDRGHVEIPMIEEPGTNNQGYSPSDYAESGPQDIEPAYDSVDRRPKDAKDKNDNRPQSGGEQGNPTYAAVDKSRKPKKKISGELHYADLSEFRKDGDKAAGGRGGIVLVPLPKGKDVKMPEAYQESDYAGLIGFKKPADDTQNPVAGGTDDAHFVAFDDNPPETDEGAQKSGQAPDPAKNEEQKTPGDQQEQPLSKEDSGKDGSDATEHSVTKL